MLSSVFVESPKEYMLGAHEANSSSLPIVHFVLEVVLPSSLNLSSSAAVVQMVTAHHDAALQALVRAPGGPLEVSAASPAVSSVPAWVVLAGPLLVPVAPAVSLAVPVM